MLNEFFFLQLITYTTVLFFFYIKDNFFFVINAIIFLLSISIFLWLNDTDIFVNFLLIIDLGVFFILLGFLINLTSIFQNNAVFYDNKIFNFILILSITALVWFLSDNLNSNNFDFNFSSILSFQNWYALLNLSFFADLQLMSDTFYLLTSFEFILMNFYLYTTILIIYLLLLATNIINVPYFRNYQNTTLSNYLRKQNMSSQFNQTATVRVWKKQLNNNDFKTNMG